MLQPHHSHGQAVVANDVVMDLPRRRAADQVSVRCNSMELPKKAVVVAQVAGAEYEGDALRRVQLSGGFVPYVGEGLERTIDKLHQR